MTEFETATDARQHIDQIIEGIEQNGDLNEIEQEFRLIAVNRAQSIITDIPVEGSALAYLTFVNNAFLDLNADWLLAHVDGKLNPAASALEDIWGRIQSLIRSINSSRGRKPKHPDIIYINGQQRLLKGNTISYEVTSGATVPFTSKLRFKKSLPLRISIGTDPECDIGIKDQSLHSKHSEVLNIGHHVYVKQLDKSSDISNSYREHLIEQYGHIRVDHKPFVLGAYVFQMNKIQLNQKRQRWFRAKAWLIRQHRKNRSLIARTIGGALICLGIFIAIYV